MKGKHIILVVYKSQVKKGSVRFRLVNKLQQVRSQKVTFHIKGERLVIR